MVYPIFLRINGKKCVVIGGGKVGERKVKRLLKDKAKILVISKDFTNYLVKLNKIKKIELVQKSYKFGDIPDDTFLVFECTGQKDVAENIARECREKRKILNSASFPQLSDFFVPSSLSKGGIEIAISTYGKSSSISRATREKISKIFPKELSKKVKLVERMRKIMKSKGKKTKEEDKLLLELSRMIFEKPELSYKEFLNIAKNEAQKIGIRI